MFVSYPEYLFVIYNNKNYGLLLIIYLWQFKSFELPWIEHRPRCNAICSKFKMASLLLKDLIWNILNTKYLRYLFREDTNVLPFNDVNVKVGRSPQNIC